MPRSRITTKARSILAILTLIVWLACVSLPSHAQAALDQLSLINEQAPAAGAANVELVGHIGGGSYTLAVSGSYAYVSFGPELAIIHVSAGAKMERVGYVVLPGFIQVVAIQGNYAYVVTVDHTLYLVDVTRPAAPRQVGRLPFPGFAHAIALAGQYAYVVGADFWVVDVANPVAPQLVGKLGISGLTNGVTLVDPYALVVGAQGLQVVDITNPTTPTLITSAFGSPGRRFCCGGGGWLWVHG